MAPGIILLVVGGIFTFAIKAESSWLDTDMLGIVLMLGGIGFIVRSRLKRREVVTLETEEQPDGSEETEETRVVERRVE